MRAIQFLVSTVPFALSGCANLNSIYRTIDIGSGEQGRAVALDIKQRAIFSAPRTALLSDGTTTTSVVVCAEPSPDALAAYGAAGGMGGTRSSGAPVQAGFAGAEAAGSVGLRTQSIQLLRDGLFSNCISYLGGGLRPNEFYELQRRSQNFTLGLLAIEQLTGAVKADQVALSTSSATATGSGDTEKESAALDDARKEQNDAQKAYEKGRLDLANARKAEAEQATKVDSAQKALAGLPKTATDAERKTAQDALDAARAELAAKREDVAVLKIDMDALARAANNADAKVASAQTALLRAQSRVSALASGTASIARAGGPAAAVAEHISAAVVSIVNAVLLESGKGEQCNALVGRLQSLPAADRAAAVAFACSAGEASSAAATAAAVDPGSRSSQIIQDAVKGAEIIRKAPLASQRSQQPTPNAPPAQPPGPANPAPAPAPN